jgi:copper resistance protein B
MRRAGRVARRLGCIAALLAAVASESRAQMPGMPEAKEMMGWGKTLFVLFDQLEYSSTGEGRPLNVEALAWYGGAYNRVWARAQSEQATAQRVGEAEAQVLYGRLVDPYWDAVIGVRVDTHWGDEHRDRAQLVLGLIGLAPYRFELEPTLYVSPRGEISGRFEAAYQFLLTQRLIAEPEVEVNAALQAVPRFGISRGINDYEMGVRFRYEFRREIAPYVGLSRSRRVGGSTNLTRAYGDPASENRVVVGLRLWR